MPDSTPGPLPSPPPPGTWWSCLEATLGLLGQGRLLVPLRGGAWAGWASPRPVPLWPQPAGSAASGSSRVSTRSTSSVFQPRGPALPAAPAQQLSRLGPGPRERGRAGAEAGGQLTLGLPSLLQLDEGEAGEVHGV